MVLTSSTQAAPGSAPIAGEELSIASWNSPAWIRLLRRCRSRCGRTSAQAIAEHTSIRQRDLHQQSSGLMALQRIDRGRYLVAKLQILILPATLLKNAGAAQFDGPMLLGGAVALRHVDLNVRVWIGPLEFSHGAGQCDFRRRIEHGEGVVSHCDSR